MQFVYPSFLYALGLIAIPIIIHLFNLVRPKTVVFSSIQFLKEVELKTSRKVRLKHILVLLSRIFFTIFLVLLFAQPYIASENAIQANKNPVVSIYIDNSYSMSAMENNEEYLNLAIKEAVEIVSAFPRNTQFQLIDNDFKSNSLFLHQKEKIIDYISEITFSNISRKGEDIYKRQLNLLRNQESEYKQIIWLSDMQQSTMGDLSFEKDTSIQYMAFKIGSQQAGNAFIDTVYLQSPFIKTNSDSKLLIKVKNSGEEKLNDVTIKLLVENKETAQTTISLAPKGTELVEMNFVLEKEGENKAEIQLMDNALLFDNKHNMVLNANEKLNVLSISDSTASNFARLYKNEETFLFTHYNVKNIQYEKLKNQDLIILEELHEIPLSLTSELKKNKNIYIAVIPKQNIDKSTYQAFYSDFEVIAKERLTVESLKLKFPEKENKLFKGVFNKIDQKVAMPSIKPIYTFSNYNEKILSYIDQYDALVRAGKQNNLFLFTGSVSKPASDLLNHSFIVPLMYKLAMESSKSNKYMYYTMNNQLHVLPVKEDSLNTIYSLQKGEVKITPEQKVIGNNLKFSVRNEDVNEGFYTLLKGDVPIKSIAFNRELSEGDLKAVSNEQIEKFNGRKLEVDSQSPSVLLSEINNGIPLWRYCLYLALLFLLVEILLIRYFKA